MREYFSVRISDDEAGVLIHILAVFDSEDMDPEDWMIIDRLYHRIQINRRDT